MKPRDEAKAKAILAATLREIEEVGLSGLSMEAVARRAKVATGTVYIYFANKEALIEAVYRATKSEIAGLFLLDPSLPVRLAFQQACLRYAEYAVAHRAEIVLMGQIYNSPYLSAETRRQTEGGVEPVRELLARGKREGLLKDLPVDMMLGFLQATLRELAAYVGEVPKKNEKERALRHEQVARLCWDALKA